MHKFLKKLSGFTQVEILVAFAISVILLSIITFNLAGSQRRSSLSSEVDKFIADFKEQQIKAMAGDGEGSGSESDYGIYFESTRYTLFRGSTYSSSNTSNFPINLPSDIQITASFPGSQVVFLKGGAEATGGCINPLNCQITIKSIIDNSEKTLKVNVYGNIYGIVSVP